MLTSLAESALGLRRSVILDSVAGTEEVRRDWRGAARAADAALVVLVCVCSDVGIHRSRLEGRQRGIPGWPELSWGDVEAVGSRWQRWPDDHHSIDSINDAETNHSNALAYAQRYL